MDAQTVENGTIPVRISHLTNEYHYHGLSSGSVTLGGEVVDKNKIAQALPPKTHEGKDVKKSRIILSEKVVPIIALWKWKM